VTVVMMGPTPLDDERPRMDFDDTPDEAAYRASVRGLLEEHAGELLHLAPGEEAPDGRTHEAELRGTERVLAEAGLVGITWPREYGGQGGTLVQQAIVAQELNRARIPGLINHIGIGMCGPTVIGHGSDEQKDRYLARLLRADDVWCQLFSEPASGSDLAALRTTAVRDGEDWIVNGQKVWTTLAHVARYGIVLVRTDPEQVKHKGMTMFVVDMHSPGVEVRPLVQATGDAEFNEVFLTDVRIPDRERLGDVGEGWGVSLTTLMNERVSIGGQVNPRGSGVIAVAVNQWKRNKQRHDAVARDNLLRLWIDAEVNRLTNMRASQSRRKGTPGPEGSVGKLAMAGLNQRIMSFVMDLMGPEALLYPSGYTFERPRSAMDLSNPQKAFLRVQANSIEGGTTNIMKNILGERVLGLPGEPRADKALPWSQVPRS
jgi:alkylation response protein AidB-like acyl-CoA dehydrogenase